MLHVENNNFKIHVPCLLFVLYYLDVSLVVEVV